MNRSFGWLLISSCTSILLLGSAPAQARDNYGSISYSSRTTAYGISVNYASRSAARNASNRECESHAGTGDCRSLLVFKNACGAIATNARGDAGTGWGTTPALAGRYAIQSCGRFGRPCRVARTLCTDR